MYLHASIMDIFRPFLDRKLSLTTFTASGATPEAVFLASLNQLKHLALEFYRNYPEASPFCHWEDVTSPAPLLPSVISRPSSSPTRDRRHASTSRTPHSATRQTPTGSSPSSSPSKAS